MLPVLNALQAPTARLAAWWRRMIEPAADITARTERRRARLLSALVLLTLFVLVPGFLFSGNPGRLAASLVLAAISYALSRSRYYRWAGLLVVIALVLPSFSIVLTAPAETLTEAGSVALPLGWLLLGMIVVSLWASVAVTWLITGITVAAVLSLTLIRPEIESLGIAQVTVLVAVTGALLSLAAVLRNGDLREIEEQSQAIDAQQQQLQLSERRYRELVENVSDIVYMVDARGYFTYVSPSASLLTGYSEAQLRGMHFTMLVEEGWRDRLIAFYRQQAAKNQQETVIVFPIITADGALRWVEQKTSLVYDDHEQMTGFQSVVRDITERKLAQDAVQQSQEQMRQVAASLNGAIYQFTARGEQWTIDYISDGVEKLFGVTAAEATQDIMNLIQRLIPEDLPRFMESVNTVVSQHLPRWEFEGRLTNRQTGIVIWFRGESTLDYADDDRVVFKGVLLDITERRQFESSLRLNSKAVETSAAGIVIADAQQPDIPLIYVNPAFEAMTGYSAAETIGRNCRFLQADDRDQPALNVLRAAIKAGRECVVILRNYRKDGTPFWNELSISPIHDDQGRLTHFVGIQNDITQRTEAENKLRALYSVMAQPNTSLEEQLNEALRIGTDILGLELGIISRVENGTCTALYVYSPDQRLRAGQAFDFRQTYCDLAYQADGVISIEHMGASKYKDHPSYAALGLEAYVGIPLVVNGQRFGTLNFSSTRPRQQPLTDSERDFFMLMGRWVSTVLSRKQAEDALRISEANLRSILDNTPTVITRADRDCRIEFTRVPGVPVELLQPLVGQSFLDFMSEEFRPRAISAIRQVFEQAATVQYESTALDPRDGQQHWYSTNAAPIIEGGRVVSALLVNNDITERIASENALRQREETLAAVAFSSEQLLLEDDWQQALPAILQRLGQATGASRTYIFQRHADSPEGAVLVSQRHEWVAEGIKPEIDNPDLQGFPISEVFPHWVDGLNRRQNIYSFADDFPPGSVARAVIDGQGIRSVLIMPIWVNNTWWGLIGFDECTGGRLWTQTEIDVLQSVVNNLGTTIERRDQEIALRETYQLLSEAQVIGRMGNWEWDIVAGELYWSDELYRINGLEPGSITPTFEQLLSSIHPDERDLVHKALLKALEGAPYEIETRVVLPDGSIRYLQNRGRVTFDDQGAPVKMSGISLDITERKIAERQVQTQNESLVRANRELAVARKQAEAANKLKSQFLATMSHELRTPLNAVIGYAQLQLAGMVGELTDEQSAFQERILANAQHLLQLINEVLDLSKIEAGRMELAERPFDLRECLDEIMIQNQVLAEDKGLTFSLTVDERLPAEIVGDRGRIKQIIINLVSNAIKFTDSGSVTIEAVLYNRESWRVTVTDTGVGIAPHLQENIFDEFRQAEHGIDRGGTGLGLAIVRKLVLMMGGNIRLNSEVGVGSAFSITLPLVTDLTHENEKMLEV